MNELEKIIQDYRNKLEQNIFSPEFIRLANLYYINGQYEECTNVCRVGLEIYPDFLTAKLILIKSLIKLQYLTEAENLFGEIIEVIPELKITQSIRKELDELKKSYVQEKIYYPGKMNVTDDYRNYIDQIDTLRNKIIHIESDDITEASSDLLFSKYFSEENYIDFEKALDSLSIAEATIRTNNGRKQKKIISEDNDKNNSIISKIKAVTETLADILARQGHKENAYIMYNKLLESDTPNKSRIREKINELERKYFNK